MTREDFDAWWQTEYAAWLAKGDAEKARFIYEERRGHWMTVRLQTRGPWPVEPKWKTETGDGT